MELVVDTNILFSFFRENPVRFVIVNSKLLGLNLFATAHTIEELRRIESDLIKYSELNSEQIESVIDELSKHISLVSSEEYKAFESEARQLVHDKDLPVFALALKLNCEIWSNEPRFKKQSKIKIFSTKELRELFKI